MADSTQDAPEPDVSEIYDDQGDAALVCRVCGCLVSREGPYPRAHWDWHETPNGV